MEFTNLPSEMKIEILSRLPIHKAIKCKLVAKSWCSLIESPEFANSHKSTPYFAVSQKVKAPPYSCTYKVYEVEDGDENSKKSSCNEAFNFSFPHPVPLHDSVNGLLFMFDFIDSLRSPMYVCNPVTREYISIPSPRPHGTDFGHDSYGFGVSRKSGQYKLVRISDDFSEEGVHRVGYQVYTLGTGQWRSFGPSSSSLSYDDCMVGAFLNGNFHWLAYKKGLLWISCFDLETELFTTLSAPRLGDISRGVLRVLRDCLGICDYSSKSKIVVWLMKDYGDEKSWTKQFVIPKMNDPSLGVIHVFKDGDILLKRFGTRVYCYYSDKTKTIQETDDLIQLHEGAYFMLVAYTPSFLPLKTFSSTENVSSF